MNELPDDLSRALKTLDARAARSAAQVDSARVAGAVLERLRVGDLPLAPRPMWHLTLVRVAAAAVLMAATVVTVRRVQWRSGPDALASLPVAMQADSFTTSQLSDMLDAIDEARAAGNGAYTLAVTVDDLTEPELQALLTALDAPAEKT